MASTSKLESKKINGTVVVVKKRALELDPSEVVPQRVYEILGDKVTLQLISSVSGDSGDYFFHFSNFLILRCGYPFVSRKYSECFVLLFIL